MEHDGHVTGGADPSSVLPGDFILPSDDSVQGTLHVNFESLDLFASMDSVPPATPIEEPPTPLSNSTDESIIHSYSARMRFSVEVDDGEMKDFNIALTHDVHFVAAHPCVPSSHTEVLRSPKSPPCKASGQSQSTSVIVSPGKLNIQLVFPR